MSMPSTTPSTRQAPPPAGTTLIIRNARVVTLTKTGQMPAGPARGEAMAELHTIDRADVYIAGARIAEVRASSAKQSKAPAPGGKSAPTTTPTSAPTLVDEIDANGRVLMPGLVDCHTHACWAGSRLDEWDQRRRGVPYLTILKRGGGIMATVRAVREATLEDLTASLLDNAFEMLAMGSTTIEVKSGYGLTLAAELKMLHAIAAAQARFPGLLVPTALLGHAIDDEQPGFVGRVTRETVPAVAAEFPGIAVDAYCEKGAWSVEQCVKLFSRARELDLPVRVHADQFNSLGMAPAALHLGATSIDHLEATTKEDLTAIAQSTTTTAVMLPACGFHADGRYARGRSLIMQGGALAIATNRNPGSAPCGSMPLVMAIAVRHMGLSPQEAITAATLNPACVLGLRDRGWIGPGARADVLLLKSADERSIAFEFGTSPIAQVIVAGRKVVGH